MSLLSVVRPVSASADIQIDFDDHVFYVINQTVFDIARSGDSRLFVLCVSFNHPHNPFVTQRSFWDLYDHSKITVLEVPSITFTELPV